MVRFPSPRDVRAAVARATANPLSEPIVSAHVADLREIDATVLARARAGAEVALARAHVAALSGAPVADVVALSRATLPEGASRIEPDRMATWAMASARCVSTLAGLVGRSDALCTVRASVWTACFGPSLLRSTALGRLIRDHDVLITGETGTGKEHVARAFLAANPGRLPGTLAPSAAINVAAVPESLVESELFGHRRGAFTGATTDRKGLVRTADGGCLFLDEVGELPPKLQSKLLRVIETDHVQPVGSDVTYAVDVRFISATHRDLRAAVAAGLFREDLYQRIAGTVLDLPPLRLRPVDLVPIGDAFLDELRHEAALQDDVDRVRAFLRRPELARCAFPGNVRELKNALRNLVLGLPSGLDETSESVGAVRDVGDVPERVLSATATLAEVEAWYVERALAATCGHQGRAAALLGIDRTTLARRRRASPTVRS